MLSIPTPYIPFGSGKIKGFASAQEGLVNSQINNGEINLISLILTPALK
ncbi:MAG: hypothetical protein SFT91_01135 [Rickettsiaceae bacterium]|nr:hypothetical protein [Rickettsiaceae bacterium]